MKLRHIVTSVLLATVVAAVPGTARAASDPLTPGGLLDDVANMLEAYGRITAPGGQLLNPAYLPALVQESSAVSVGHLTRLVASPTRPSLTAATLVPGWDVGNPLRAGWDGTRGEVTPVAFTNRYGALLRGDVYTPRAGATDPYSGVPLTGPYPGVVITPGSVQGSKGMYQWLAQDLAERGYVVLLYDVQGQGSSETLPHTTGSTFPFCNPFAPKEADEQTPCPGVTSQQPANFVKGTEDATDFFFSTPDQPYANPGSAGADVDAFNPRWEQFDRSPDPDPATPGRTSRFAIVGHSLGAAAVSKVQGTDERVSAVVALDKLQGGGFEMGPLGVGDVQPVVPALGVQSEYGFVVTPAALSSGSSIVPLPGLPVPMRERSTGFEAWRAAGVDTMVVVPRASTHLEYTDIPLVLPASRHGQALTSAYVQRWLDRYLKHVDDEQLLATSFPYLEPTGGGAWTPTTVDRRLSARYCSAYDVAGLGSRGDVSGVGGCTP